MPATAEKLEGSRVRLAVEVPPEDLQKEYSRAIQRVGLRVKVPGFRPGKAPRRLVENAAGVGTVMQDLLEAVVPRAYTSALSETGVNPIDQPELDVPELPSLDAPFLFSAEVAVAPTVELGDVDDVSISVPVEEVAEDEIDAEIEQLRVTQASWEPVERPAVAEDMVQTRIRILAAAVEPEEPQPYNVLVGEQRLSCRVRRRRDRCRGRRSRFIRGPHPAERPQRGAARRERHVRDSGRWCDRAPIAGPRR